jgi:hypothetical protein
VTYRGVLQDDAFWTALLVQYTLFTDTDQNSACGVHDAFRYACRPARVYDQKWVAESYALEHQLLLSICSLQKLIQRHCPTETVKTRGVTWKPWLGNYALEFFHTAHAFNNLLDLRLQVRSLAVIHRPVVDKDVCWFDLKQTFEDALSPHIRTTAAEQSAQAHNRHESDEGIETRARYDSHSITFLHTICS